MIYLDFISWISRISNAIFLFLFFSMEDTTRELLADIVAVRRAGFDESAACSVLIKISARVQQVLLHRKLALYRALDERCAVWRGQGTVPTWIYVAHCT